MQKVNLILAFCMIILLITTATAKPFSENKPSDETPSTDHSINYHHVLFEYMKNNNNENFKYELLNSIDIPNQAKFYVFNMTSVKWLTDRDISRIEWYHFVEIVIPYQLTQSKQALMLITGGSSKSDVPTLDKDLIQMSILTKSIVCAIHQIPNQPLVFLSDPLRKERVEDAILAFAWARFMNLTSVRQDLSNTEWIPRLPMVKSSLLAMDLVQEYLKKNLNLKVEEFHVAGASKRGWTTNLIGVVDPRVKSIIPIVIPVWKTRDILEHTYNSLCKWPEAMGNYVEEGIINRLNSIEFHYLTQVIDPFEYNTELSGKYKYFVNAVGDEFFVPELSQFSYPFIKGSDQRKHLRYIPNSDHSMDGTDAQLTVLTYYYSLINNITLPSYNFKLEHGTNDLIVNIVNNGLSLKSILLWENYAPNRDFRQVTIGKTWTSRDVSNKYNSQNGHLVVHLETPTNGKFYAAFVELTFDIGNSMYVKFTTSVYILPDFLPCQY